MLYVILSVILFVVSLALYFFLGSGQKSTILITGPCDAGKTAMLMMLIHKKMPMTFTSLSPNNEEYKQKVKVTKI